MHKCVCVYILYVCMYVCMYVCIYVCLYVCMPVCMPVCVYVCMCTRMRAPRIPICSRRLCTPNRKHTHTHTFQNMTQSDTKGSMIRRYCVKHIQNGSAPFATLSVYCFGLWSGCCPDGHSWGGRRVVRSPVDRQGRRLHPLSSQRKREGKD